MNCRANQIKLLRCTTEHLIWHFRLAMTSVGLIISHYNIGLSHSYLGNYFKGAMEGHGNWLVVRMHRVLY